jgi:peptide/nickel transport system substrate-binding protein
MAIHIKQEEDMYMVIMKKVASLVLAACMLLAMVGSAVAEAAAPEREANALVIGYTEFNEKFSPFYAESGYDSDVANYFTALPLMVTDRVGGIIYNAIQGETVPYNGIDYTYTGIADLDVTRDEAADTTLYTAKLRDDIKFSDGAPLTADDLIFTYYALLDPSYVGPVTLNSYDIVGLKAYQTQTPEDIYDKYDALVKEIYKADAAHEWAEGDAWTKEQQDAFWAGLATAWADDVQAIVDYVVANYNSDDYAPAIGSTPADIEANPGLGMAFGLVMWGFASYDADVLTAPTTGQTWNLTEGVYPTIDEAYAEVSAKYAGNPEVFFATEMEGVDATATLATAQQAFVKEQSAAEPAAAAGVPNITGIQKIDDYTVAVTVKGFSAPAVYQIFGITVAPLHYYGDMAQYDYAANKFGFPFGDLSTVQAKTTQPLGFGPYKFVKYENKVVYLEANDLYWKGAPKIKYVQLKETLDSDKTSGVLTATLDVSDPSFNKDTIATIKEANGGEFNGPKLFTNTVNNLGYGYIGVTATNVGVGGEAGSDASKNLRRALFTALALYRDVVIDSYYGEIASVINYPISNTSWAAPQKTDEDYKVAFSTDIDGNDIYTADMTMEQKEAAATAAIIGYLKAAGYTFDEATGKFTAAPEGALMEYEAIIGGGGTGDHPSFGILTDAKALLETIGITLTIGDISDFSVIMDKVKSASAQLYCMAWQATIDPDMYQVYHSDNVLGAGGTDSNSYMVADAELDQLIMDARNSADQSYRKAIYKAALDRIIDWAVELPVYQRQNATIFSAERVNTDTLPGDMTTYYGFAYEIEKLELK